jgi:hypothetical protein
MERFHLNTTHINNAKTRPTKPAPVFAVLRGAIGWTFGAAHRCATFQTFWVMSGFDFFLLPNRIHTRPQAGNASRWAA